MIAIRSSGYSAIGPTSLSSVAAGMGALAAFAGAFAAGACASDTVVENAPQHARSAAPSTWLTRRARLGSSSSAVANGMVRARARESRSIDASPCASSAASGCIATRQSTAIIFDRQFSEAMETTCTCCMNTVWKSQTILQIRPWSDCAQQARDSMMKANLPLLRIHRAATGPIRIPIHGCRLRPHACTDRQPATRTRVCPRKELS
ncbi:hypothetical protein OKW50_003703 [Paraburkholderia youngii]